MPKEKQDPEHRALLLAAADAFGFTGAQAEEALNVLGNHVEPNELLEWLEENYPQS